MPGPGGTYAEYQAQHMSQPNLLKKPSTGPNIEQPKQTKFGGKTATGLAAGSATGNPWLAVLGAGIGLAGDVISWRQSYKVHKEDRDFNAQQASAAFAREQMAQREAANWNSEMAQVERLKKAGLSPALAYGQMGPSTMGAASGTPAQAGSTPQADFNADGLGVYNAAVAAEQASSLMNLQASEAAQTDAERVATEINNITRHRQNLAQLEQMLQAAGLDKATKEKIKFMMETERQQLLASIDNLGASTKNLNAQADFVSGVQTDLTKANVGLVNERVKTERSIQDLNSSYKAFYDGPLTSKTLQEVKTNYELSRVYLNQANKLALEYGLNQRKVDLIAEFLDKRGYDINYLPYALEMLNQASLQSGKSIVEVAESWISGNNWIPFISQSRDRSSRESIAEMFIDSNERINDSRIESNERIAAGHDASQMSIADQYITSGARSHSNDSNSRLNEYRAEYPLLSSHNKRLVNDFVQSLKDSGVSDSDISERAAFFTHKLYEDQIKFRK